MSGTKLYGVSVKAKYVFFQVKDNFGFVSASKM